MSKDPLDELIERLNQGDISAAERALLAYEPYLRMAVRRRLSGPLRAKFDSLDVVQSVWADVLMSFRDSGKRFNDRSHLRAFLVKVARNRLIDRRRQHHRAIEKERALVEAAPNQLPEAREPRPSEVAQGNELWKAMLDECARRTVRSWSSGGRACVLARSRPAPDCTKGASAALSTTWRGGWRSRAPPRPVPPPSRFPINDSRHRAKFRNRMDLAASPGDGPGVVAGRARFGRRRAGAVSRAG